MNAQDAQDAPDAQDAHLTREELQRYSRHLLLPEFGEEGQRRLRGSSVLIVGAGGLGSPLALYLAAAGVGHIGLVDFDLVDASNLQRQVLYGTSDVGSRKLEAGSRRLRDLNPHVRITTHDTRLTSGNALEIFRGYDVVADGTDNFATRYLVNDACVLLGIPNAYGSIFRFDGQASVFAAPGGPCYRCVFPEPPPPGQVPSCAEGGVLGVLPGMVGVLQATEVIKLVTGIGEPLVGRLLLVDALTASFRTVLLRRDPSCPACGTRSLTELADYEQFCGTGERQPATGSREITPSELAVRIGRGEDLDVVDVRERHEWDIARIPGARLIPLGELPRRLEELDRSREIVVHCKSGARSARAVALLEESGFERVVNLAGGIARWSQEVDSTMPRY